jgi:hypothetical protein
MFKRWLLIAAVLILNFGTFELQVANASTPRWGVDNFSDLTQIDQFENRHINFILKIEDPAINHLTSQSGYEIITSLTLVNKELNIFSDPKAGNSLTYFCYDHPTTAIGGYTGGSALRAAGVGDDSLKTYSYSCWLPKGMRLGNYDVRVTSSLALNGSGPVRDSNNQILLNQAYIFSTDISTIPSSIRYFNLQPFDSPAIANVIRSTPISDPSSLTFNEQNLVALTNLKNSKVSSAVNNLREIQSSIDKFRAMISEANSLRSLALKSPLLSRYRSDFNQFDQLLNRIGTEGAFLETSVASVKPGLSEDDVSTKYLWGLDFQAVGSPVILVAQYPDLTKLTSMPTPYLKFVIKSKTAIANMRVQLAGPAQSSEMFSGNLILPGEKPLNDQMGGGLALVQDQSWDGSMFLSTFLVGPRYTPASQSDLSALANSNQSIAYVNDVAGNSSGAWVVDSNHSLPPASQAEVAKGDFDRLVSEYENLFEANEAEKKSYFFSDALIQLSKDISADLNSLEKIQSQLKLDFKSATPQKLVGKTAQQFKIKCRKGNSLVTVFGVNPICPKGFVKTS